MRMKFQVGLRFYMLGEGLEYLVLNFSYILQQDSSNPELRNPLAFLMPVFFLFLFLFEFFRQKAGMPMSGLCQVERIFHSRESYCHC